jgi:hypothetical protein
MYALISPNEQARYISSWNGKTPVFTQIGERIAQVSDSEFSVATPLFWISCADDIVADKYYYDSGTQTIIAVPSDAPRSNTA